MNFIINSTTLKYENNFSDNLIIKSTNKNYEVLYLNENLKSLIDKNYEKNDFIIIDKNVYNLDTTCLINIEEKNYHIFEATELNKTVEYVLHLFDILFDINFNKKNKLIVIGGGITQDLSGFLAAIFKRGIKWIFIPTTLLSITDSAIGSKVNVNRKSKNMVGLFYAPDKIYISNFFLNSLSNDDIISGLGEALKLCLIGGQYSLEIFEENYKNKNLDNIIKISTLIKKSVIEFDELEKSERKALNYGHEIGHALESCSNYFIPHGIGVLFGIYIVNKLFYNDKYMKINDLVLSIIPEKYKKINLDYNNFIIHLLNDKKNIGNNICFIVLDDIGKISFKYRELEIINSNLRKIFDVLFINKI